MTTRVIQHRRESGTVLASATQSLQHILTARCLLRPAGNLCPSASAALPATPQTGAASSGAAASAAYSSRSLLCWAVRLCSYSPQQAQQVLSDLSCLIRTYHRSASLLTVLLHAVKLCAGSWALGVSAAAAVRVGMQHAVQHAWTAQQVGILHGTTAGKDHHVVQTRLPCCMWRSNNLWPVSNCNRWGGPKCTVMTSMVAAAMQVRLLLRATAFVSLAGLQAVFSGGPATHSPVQCTPGR